MLRGWSCSTEPGPATLQEQKQRAKPPRCAACRRSALYVPRGGAGATAIKSRLTSAIPKAHYRSAFKCPFYFFPFAFCFLTLNPRKEEWILPRNGKEKAKLVAGDPARTTPVRAPRAPLLGCLQDPQQSVQRMLFSSIPIPALQNKWRSQNSSGEIAASTS